MSLGFGSVAAGRPHGSGSPDELAGPTVCIANIGPQERQRRLAFGIVALVFGLALAAALILTGVHSLWRIVLFLPFASAGIGYFQARDKT